MRIVLENRFILLFDKTSINSKFLQTKFTLFFCKSFPHEKKSIPSIMFGFLLFLNILRINTLEDEPFRECDNYLKGFRF